MTDDDQETVTVPKGDPVFSIYIWRQDSITLTRLRPLLEEFDHLADRVHCDRADLGGEECSATPSLSLGEWCFPCRFKLIRFKMHQVV